MADKRAGYNWETVQVMIAANEVAIRKLEAEVEWIRAYMTLESIKRKTQKLPALQNRPVSS
jgi:hypothetical protein